MKGCDLALGTSFFKWIGKGFCGEIFSAHLRIIRAKRDLFGASGNILPKTEQLGLQSWLYIDFFQKNQSFLF